jgi:hypothetical protein
MDHLVVPLDLVAAMCAHSIDIYERRIIVKEIAERLHTLSRAADRNAPIRHSVARLTDLVPLVVERKILVEDSLADRLNSVEPRITLVARLEERRNVGRHRELQAMRCVHSAVVLHEDDRAVISLKRRVPLYGRDPTERSVRTGRGHGKSRGSSSRTGEEIACQWPAQPERAARRHRQPALLQVADAPDGRGDRLVIDPGQQVLQ